MSVDLPTPAKWLETIFDISNNESLEAVMMQAYRIQYANNPIYQRFCNLVGRSPENVKKPQQIPYLPVSFFKSYTIITGEWRPVEYFESSGTTGMTTSRHYYNDPETYEAVFENAFEAGYGSPGKYCILGLLPSYLERSHSSLVFMVERLMAKSGHGLNGFFLQDHQRLAETLRQLEEVKQPTIIIGVTYALLDFADRYPMQLDHTIIMETGGMKGRKKELVRAEVHGMLKSAFGLESIHSEYGMTELFSQAYAKHDGFFVAPPWMKVTIREEDDPLGQERSSGVIYIADLANLHSCCFIATEDQGRMHADGSFEVVGRIDNSDIRGCSLLAMNNT